MPSLRLLVVRLFPKLLGATQRYYARYSSGPDRSTSAWKVSRSLGESGTTSHVEWSEHPADVSANQIACQKTYTVEYVPKDDDDAELFYMPDTNRETARPGSATSET